MQDHEFEKQVHQKMQELNLLPSEAVWKKVERKLNVKIRSRRWIIWFPLLLVALSIGGYMLYNSIPASYEKQLPSMAGGKTKYRHQDGNQKNSSNNNISESNNQGKPKTPQLKEQLKNENVEISSGTNEQTPSSADLKKGNAYKSYKPDAKISLPDSSKYNLYEGGRLVLISPLNTQRSKDLKSDSAVLIGEILNSDSGNIITSKNLIPAIIKAHIATNDSINTSKCLINLRFPVITPMQKKQRKSKLEWGLAFQGGSSGITNGNFNTLFSNAAVADVNNSLALNNPSSTSASYTPPSELRPGLGFSTGVHVKKQLTPRLSMSAGIKYTQFSTSHKVGKRIDSSIVLRPGGSSDQKTIEEHFRVGNTESYVNRYHFIELPLILQAKLTGNRFVPVYWDLGLSISRLVSSNALHFDGNSRIYYEDNGVFNRNQFNFITGLPVQIISRDRFSFQAGPQIQYGISNLINRDRTGGKHLLFIGLKAEIGIFNK